MTARRFVLDEGHFDTLVRGEVVSLTDGDVEIELALADISTERMQDRLEIVRLKKRLRRRNGN